jgi:hypothetical protein
LQAERQPELRPDQGDQQEGQAGKGAAGADYQQAAGTCRIDCSKFLLTINILKYCESHQDKNNLEKLNNLSKGGCHAV